MQLPPAGSAAQTRVRYGTYVARRLRRAKYKTLADDATNATKNLRDLSRAWEDTDDATQEAMADRDGADDDLDTTAQDGRAQLAGRSANAMSEEPYTLIYPEGIGYYTAAPQDAEVKRYGELSKLLTEHLPANDPVRKKSVKEIAAGVESYKAAIEALEAAQTAETLAATRLTKATDAWERQMEKTYGALVSEIGRARAEGFFPRIKRNKVAKKTDGGAPPT